MSKLRIIIVCYFLHRYLTSASLLQVLSFQNNPYKLLSTDRELKSRVVSIDLADDKAQKIEVSNLNSDITISVPLAFPKDTLPSSKKHIARSGFLSYHKVAVAEKGTFVDFKINPSTNGAVFEAFVKFGKPPTTDSYDFKLEIPDYSTCTTTTENTGSLQNRMCENDPYKVFKEPVSEIGDYFVGLMAKNASSKQQTRKKRSCFGNGRDKRSCVEVKELPSVVEVSAGSVPAYDPNKDANYSVAIDLAKCFYWSSAARLWVSDGCKVSYKPCDVVTITWFG